MSQERTLLFQATVMFVRMVFQKSVSFANVQSVTDFTFKLVDQKSVSANKVLFYFIMRVR